LNPLFAVTLNWNLKADTIACVESVLASGLTRERVVVVDNGSTDDSVAAIRAHFGPDLPLICNKRNLGYAGGMNAGIRFALERGAASVLLLNNDTVIAPTMANVLLEASDALEESGILGPAIYYYDEPGRIWRLGDRRHRWLPMPRIVHLADTKGATPDPFQVDYVTGCGMLILRRVFERIGYLDERYFMYFEDADFCRRARDAGYTVWCVPQAQMWHKVSLTAQRDKPLNRYHRALGQVRFYHEHAHGPSALLREGYILAKVLKTMGEDLVRKEWNLVAPLWRGTIDGYRELQGQSPHPAIRQDGLR
jgi:GT2 family glycosyltransferase